MPKVSINILTKDRPETLKRALLSIQRQSFQDFEIRVCNEGSDSETEMVLKDFLEKMPNLIVSDDPSASLGITKGRDKLLRDSTGEYIAPLDDDDEWIDVDKLKKQVEFLDQAKGGYVLVGGGIELVGDSNKVKKFRQESDQKIRQTMLLRNNFFTSTVMFDRQKAIEAGGFIQDDSDLAEDYDLWLRLGKLGKMHNFQEVFASYSKPQYNKRKYQSFLNKQLRLINKHKHDYSGYSLASLLLRLRLLFLNLCREKS